MHLSRVTFGSVGLSVLLLLVPKQSSGDKDDQRTVTLTINCETRFDASITSPGVTQDPPDIYVCEGQKVRWYANGHTIIVTFKNKSPFVDHQTAFKASGTEFVESDKMDHFDHIQGFPFSINVDGHTYDPQIIGGGGH